MENKQVTPEIGATTEESNDFLKKLTVRRLTEEEQKARAAAGNLPPKYETYAALKRLRCGNGHDVPIYGLHDETYGTMLDAEEFAHALIWLLCKKRSIRIGDRRWLPKACVDHMYKAINEVLAMDVDALKNYDRTVVDEADDKICNKTINN